ncbi:hypothetical protein HAX54_052616 [Datura stramonium]|uniref:RNase H type-1 domain-containing protein n=1 Tax=Datura stramonium TaxID=4076 RepID=A0ABS8T091_DATST|nr:hypothetical protein [Datura stramonium]
MQLGSSSSRLLLLPSTWHKEISFQDDLVASSKINMESKADARNEGKLNAEKLIIESDNFMLVQYVNVYHVYEEANEAARDWALRDECPNNGPNAASERKIYVGNLHLNMTELQLR